MFKQLTQLIRDLFQFDGFERIQDEACSYQLPPNLYQKFNWEGFNPETGFFEFNDNRSVAAIYGLSCLPTEGQTMEYLKSLRQGFEQIFRDDTFTPYTPSESPWIIQFYVQDEFDLTSISRQFTENLDPVIRTSRYSEFYQRILSSHLAWLSERSQFTDPLSRAPFRGRIRQIRCVIYRKHHAKSVIEKGLTPETELRRVTIKFEENLKQIGVTFKRYREIDFYVWMRTWLSPKPRGFQSAKSFLESVKFPEENKKPIGFDFTQMLFSEPPKSNRDKNCWYFDGVPHQFVPILGFRQKPVDGHLSAERKMTTTDDLDKSQFYAPLDQLPMGSIFMMSVVIEHQNHRKRAIQRIQKRARKIAESEARMALEEAEHGLTMIATKNFIYPVSMGVYIRGEDDADLSDKVQATLSALGRFDFNPLPDTHDERALDRYIRHLPMNYNYRHDEKYLFQNRLCSIEQISACLPLYGRTRGTKHFGFIAFNRLTEPYTFDPIKDSVNNQHGLILGTTGSGKSALSISFLMSMMAVHRPRMILIDAGGSMQYMAELMAHLGVSVNRIEISNKMPDFSLNPFAKTKEMLEQVARLERTEQALLAYEKNYQERLDETKKRVVEEDLADDFDETRDYLMEFTTAAILLVTGGEQKEIDNLNRQDRFLLIESIKDAGLKAVANRFDQMIPSDLAQSLLDKANELEKRRQDADISLITRLRYMANSIQSFINIPLNAMYFNQRQAPLPDVDVTWFELGLFKDDKPMLEASRALAFVTLMNEALSKAERYKTSGRKFLFFADECHIVTSKTITSASVIQASKMGRKVGLMLWLATQNVRDFPESARKVLSMLEFKILLWCDRNERTSITEFLELSQEQQNVLRSLRKIKQKYVEGMLISNNFTQLFRNVPPREVLALAMTDPDENTVRAKLMREFKCDGTRASLLIAQALKGEAYDLAKINEVLS